MTDKQTEALKLALEAMGWTDEWRPEGLKEQAITAIREALAEQPNIAKYLEKDNSEQPAQQQEPFGYFKAEPFGWTDCSETDDGAIALYKRPQPAQPSKPWVGLTDEEKMGICERLNAYNDDLIDAIEAKLREKNT